MKPGARKVNVSSHQYAQLQALADFYGHENVDAALATLIKFGIPAIMTGNTLVMRQNTGTIVDNSGTIQNNTAVIHDNVGSTKENTKAERKNTKAERKNTSKVDLEALGFKHNNDTTGLVAEVLAGGSLAGSTGAPKGEWTVPDDDAIASLPVEDF